MTFEFTPVTPERTVELFLYCVGILRVNDEGLAAGHDMSDLNAAAFLSHMMKALAIVPRDVHDVVLFELADATEALLVSSVVPTDSDVVGRWTKARVSVLQSELDAL